MKKILIIILFFVSVIINAQTYPRWFADDLFYPKLTTLGSTDWIQINHDGQTSIISGTSLASFLGDRATMLSSYNPWTALNAFSGSLTIPGTLDATLVNGIGFNSGLFAWSDGNGDSLHYGASRAWVSQMISDSGITGDLSAYMTKAGNETISGIKTYSNVNDFRTGSTYFPYKTSYTASVGNSGGFNYSDGTMRFQTKDASNNKYDLTMADRAWVTANFSQVTGFIKSTGTQTGVNSLITLSGGYFNFASAALIIGVNTPTYTGQLTYDLDQGESGLHVKLASGELYMPDDAEVQDMIDLSYTYNLPEVITNGDDTLSFTNDRNFVKSVMTVAADNNLLVKFANSGYGNITILVIGGWNSSGTISWDTSIAGETLKWVGGIEPPLDTSTSDQVFNISFMKVTSSLIIGQWNWAE